MALELHGAKTLKARRRERERIIAEQEWRVRHEQAVVRIAQNIDSASAQIVFSFFQEWRKRFFFNSTVGYDFLAARTVEPVHSVAFERWLKATGRRRGNKARLARLIAEHWHEIQRYY